MKTKENDNDDRYEGDVVDGTMYWWDKLGQITRGKQQ